MTIKATDIPVDLILFGMVAAFLILRLRSVLGKRTGLDRPAAPPSSRRPFGPTIEGRSEPTPPSRPLPDPASPLGRRLASFRDVERGFDPAVFLRGAEAAFRRIVEAFASGDRAALRSLLTDPTFRAFEQVIAQRESDGQTQRSEIRSVHQATIEEARLVDERPSGGRRALIDVRFVSDQINLTLAADGQPVLGTDAVTELVDRWVFERLYPGDVTWRLAEASSV